MMAADGEQTDVDRTRKAFFRSVIALPYYLFPWIHNTNFYDEILVLCDATSVNITLSRFRFRPFVCIDSGDKQGLQYNWNKAMRSCHLVAINTGYFF